MTNGATVPNGATAAVFSIAAVNPIGPGLPHRLSVLERSCRTPRRLNFVGGQTVANSTIAALSSAGQLCVWTYGRDRHHRRHHRLARPEWPSRFIPIGPTRVVDTRSAIGGHRVAPDADAVGRSQRVRSGGLDGRRPQRHRREQLRAGLPDRVPVRWPLPETSTVNHVAREARPNNTIVGLIGGPGLHLQLRRDRRARRPRRVVRPDRVLLQADAAGSGDRHPPVPPAGGRRRRRWATAWRRRRSAATQPSAAFVNVTATNHTVPGYVTTFDCGVRRETSTLNQQVGETAANGAIVPLAANLQSCAWMYGGGHLIVDLNGWWVP